MMNKLIAFIVCCLTLATLCAQDRSLYYLTAKTGQNAVFFRMTDTEKQALLDRVQLVHSIPADAVDTGVRSVNKNSALTGKVIAGSLDHSTIWHVIGMKRKNNTIILKTAKNMDQVVAGLVMEPDQIVLDPSLDPEKVRKFLLDPVNVPELYRNIPPKPEIVENFETCGKRQTGANLRVMSYNILAGCWGGGKMPNLYRLPMIVEVIKKVAPDFAGLQEVDVYNRLKTQLHPYRIVEKPRNMCSILYNTEKYKFLAGDSWSLLEKNSGIRCLVWCLFQEIGSDRKIIITNTHWELNETARLMNARKMAEYIAALQKKYPGVPIVSTGDFNTSVHRDDLKLFFQLSSMKDAIEHAPYTENKQISSFWFPAYAKYPSRGGRHIDHIISTDELHLVGAKLIVGGITYEASDHLPVVADYLWK